MRAILSLTALLFAMPSLAQEVGESVTLISETRSQRFLDADVTGPTFQAGEAATVLFVQDEQVRLRRGDRFGWVAKSAVTAVSAQPLEGVVPTEPPVPPVE